MPRIEPIRVEMLSTEMPVHQLSKKGAEEIRIIRRGRGGGQVEFYWKVEPNLAVGRPGQLAYHLDTWIIRRRLYELPRPLPRLVPVGDLRPIARDLGHGGDTNAVKEAFAQNAAAFIRAKLTYRGRAGEERSFEGYFTRYNVFFRGQTLPGGRSAETVYLGLNDPYYALLNESTWRPLDFDYLRSLTPAAQRFYELVSPKMFAVIKNGHSTAWLRYSEFCQLAVQKRYDTRRRMQIQMAAVHRPHLLSGYVAEVSYRRASSQNGLLDWIIHYVPGSRARAEFAAFNGARNRAPQRVPARLPAPEPTGKNRHVIARGGSDSSDQSTARALAMSFAERRFGLATEVTADQLRQARIILDACGGDDEVATTAVHLAAKEGRDSRSGFPRVLGGVLKGGYIEIAKAAKDQERRRHEAADRLQDERARHERYEHWCGQRAERRIRALPAERRGSIVDERLSEFVEKFRYYFQLRGWDHDRIRAWAEPRILERYGREGEPTFEAWRERYDESATGTSGPDEALQ